MVKRRKVLNYELRDFVSFDIVERTGTAYDGGTHRRLRFTLADETSVLFVVKNIDEAATFFSGVIGQHAESTAA